LGVVGYQVTIFAKAWSENSNVNPGLTNPKSAVELGGYHQKVLDEMTIGGVPAFF